MSEIVIETHAEAERPTGSTFKVEQCLFRPGEHIDVETINIPEDRIFDWPMVYILANDDTAYVGQTTSVATRMDQHGANEEKKDFTTVNIIYNEEFNTSVITDYEHRLIELMHADGHYTLTNKNDGMTETNYFSKNRYEEMFEDLWDELRDLELVEHSISYLEETEVFKYSPFKGLTPDQRVALEDIMATIDAGLEDAKPIVVEGMPGTGKTVLAIYLLKSLRDNPKFHGLNVRIMEPVTSLRETLRTALKGVSGLSPDDIISPTDLAKPKYGFRADTKGFDIVLVDEAHKLKRRKNIPHYRAYDDVNRALGLPHEATQMDWILNQVRLPVFFYDPLQAIGPSCIQPETMRSLLGESLDHPVRLESQMRVTGGKEYLSYVRAILDDNNPEPRDFSDTYDFVLHDSFRDFVDSFEREYSEHDLSRMIAGYAWKWNTQKKSRQDFPDAYDIGIDGIHLRWNCTYNNWVVKGSNDVDIAHEVGCIHSIQGYDLSYAYVLIGNDLQYNEASGQIVANKSSYFDRNGYATATTEKLNTYIKNIYYVLLTRGIYGTHVYVCNPALREHMKHFIRTA